MTITISGTTGLAGVDGSAASPAIQGNDTNTGIFFPAADTIAFAEGGAEVARFDSSGNLGVGTSSPSTYANGAAPTLVVGTGNNWVVAQPRTDGPSGAGNGVRIAGNYLTNPKPGAAFWIGAQGGAGQRGMLGFFTKDTDDNTNEPTERARIDSSGRLLINLTSSISSAAVLQVQQNCLTGVMTEFNDTDTTSTNNVIRFRKNGTEAGRIAVTTSNTTQYLTSSDYRLKENVQPMTGALARVALLKPCTYTWKSTGEASQGFIAHELAQVCPDAVSGEKDAVDEDGNIKPQGIDTSFLVATLTAAIQEQQALIAALQADVAALKGQA